MPTTTIKDVARAAGVSIATVSYVINNGPRPVSAETRRRVQEVMDRLAFEPNVSARRLRMKENRVLGLAVAGLSGRPGIADLYFLDTLRGISIAADRLDYDLMLFSNHHKLQTEEYFRSLAHRRVVDGLIASGGAVNPRGLELLPGAGLPVVVVGRQQPVEGLCRIEFSYQEDAYQAACALIGRGHRRIGLLLNAPIFWSEHLRLAGYQQALAEAGLQPDPELVYSAPEPQVYPPREVVQGLVTGRGATALITSPFLEVCAFLREIDPHGSCEVATLDFDEYTPRPASLVLGIRLAKFEAGALAVELLVQAIRRDPNLPGTNILPSHFEFGAV
jgi:LacI family transcriptional regulator